MMRAGVFAANTCQLELRAGQITMFSIRPGIYIARFDHPEDEEIVIVKKGHAYARISEDERGIPLIKRYRISWK